MFYQNNITSLVTVPNNGKTLNNLHDVIEFGYTIIWSRDTSLSLPHKRFYIDFQLYGVANKINNSFLLISGRQSLFLARSGKLESYALITSEKLIERDKGNTEKTIREHSVSNITAKCNIVPEGFHQKSYHWVVSGVNLPWLILSMERIKQAGLNNKWEDWSVLANKLYHKTLLGTKDSALESDNINSTHLVGIFLLGIFANVFGVIVLFCEYISIYDLSLSLVKDYFKSLPYRSNCMLEKVKFVLEYNFRTYLAYTRKLVKYIFNLV